MRKLLFVTVMLALIATSFLSCKSFPTAAGTVRTSWDVRWFNMTNQGQWISQLGTSQFPGNFFRVWGDGPVYGSYSDDIGFQAYATVNMQRPGGGYVQFYVGSDDGCRLYLDGSVIAEYWPGGVFSGRSPSVYLSPGKHTLRLDYWESYGFAAVGFCCDTDILEWQE
jgi:hypothetical protein